MIPDMNGLVRIYMDRPHPKNYYRFMTVIGPCFGATQAESPIMTRREACDLIRSFPLGYGMDEELEDVEGAA